MAISASAKCLSSEKKNHSTVMRKYYIKDFFFAKIFQPKPTFVGDPVPVIGNGGVTDDKIN
jgi:SanA protein